MTDGETIAQFADAMRERGIIPPNHVLADGKLHRCDATGRHAKGDAAYVLHLDHVPAGGFENHRDGHGWENWRADVEREFTAVEREVYRQRVAEARAQRDEDDRQRRAAAASKANVIWGDAVSECNGFPYLEAKHIGAHGARLWSDKLIVPVRDIDGALISLQFIDETGGKRFLTGGRTGGCCCVIGEIAGAAIIIIAEGFATAATVFEATCYPVVIAFNATNLPPVATAIRLKYPHAKIVIAADDDHLSAGNPGVTKAREAAAAIAGVIAIPDFGIDRPKNFTDFNDLSN